MPPPDGARHGRSVGYLGPEGTFSEQALFASARAADVEPVALATIHDAITAVESGAVRWALVPIENALEGSLAVTLDLLAEHSERLQIAGEAVLAVHHALIAPRAVELSQIDNVLTHPQVPGQCTEFLRSELATATVVPTTSTAEAVRAVAADADDGRAAIGTTLAAEIYGAVVLRERIEDHDDNETRFVWLRGADDEEAPPLAAVGETSHTSLIFWGPGTERAGWLVKCLDEFARRDVNLTKIESRPRRGRLGTYMFFADLVGSARDPLVEDAIEGLSALCDEVRLLGSYPASAQ